MDAAAVGPAAGMPLPAARAARVAVRGAAPPWTAFHWAVTAMLLTYVWRFQDLFPLIGKFKPAALASAAALWLLFTGPLARLVPRLRQPIIRAALGLLLLAIASVPTSLWPGHSFGFLRQDYLKTLMLMLLVVAAVRTLHDVERLMTVHVVGGALYCGYVLANFSVGADGRLSNLVYYDANDLALLAVCTFPMVVYHLRPGGRPLLRLAAAVVLLELCLTVVRTGSRGGFLGLIGVFAVMLFTFRSVPALQRVGFVVVVFTVLNVAGGDAFWQKMGTLLNPSEDYNWSGKSDGGRMDVWKRGIGYMVQRPLLGVGVNAFSVAEGTISPLAARQELGQGLKWSTAHNSFVQIAAELGVFGIAGFLVMLGAAFRITWRAGRERRPYGPAPPQAALGQALMGSLVGYCVSGFFLSQAYSAYLYTVLGLVAALACVQGMAIVGSGAAPAAPQPLRPVPAGRGGLVVGAPRGDSRAA